MKEVEDWRITKTPICPLYGETMVAGRLVTAANAAREEGGERGGERDVRVERGGWLGGGLGESVVAPQDSCLVAG